MLFLHAQARRQARRGRCPGYGAGHAGASASILLLGFEPGVLDPQFAFGPDDGPLRPELDGPGPTSGSPSGSTASASGCSC